MRLNRRSAHGFGRVFCSPPRRLRYAGRFCPLPPRAPIFGFERPQSAFSGGESRDMRGEKGGCKYTFYCILRKSSGNYKLDIDNFGVL